MPSPQTWLKRLIAALLERRGYRLERIESPTDPLFEELVEARLRAAGDFFFVQIGANDGVSFDPLHPILVRHADRVRGLVVEPLRDKFELLRRTYAALPGVVPVNAAIHRSERRMTLYRVDPARERRLPAWAKGIASFDPHHHERTRTAPGLIVAEEVDCLPLAELLERHGVDHVDVLVTDTEGYDYEIVSGLDFARLKPALIHFEHGMPHGVMSPARFRALAALLARNGYSLHVRYFDALAFLPE